MGDAPPTQFPPAAQVLFGVAAPFQVIFVPSKMNGMLPLTRLPTLSLTMKGKPTLVGKTLVTGTKLLVKTLAVPDRLSSRLAGPPTELATAATLAIEPALDETVTLRATFCPLVAGLGVAETVEIATGDKKTAASKLAFCAPFPEVTVALKFCAPGLRLLK